MGEGKQDSQADMVKNLIKSGASEVFFSGKMVGANFVDNDDFAYELEGDFEDSYVLRSGEKPKVLSEYDFWWIFD